MSGTDAVTRGALLAGFKEKFPDGFSPMWENVAESAKIRV
jgi:hypothetical protein